LNRRSRGQEVLLSDGGLEQKDRRPGGLSFDAQHAPDLLISCETCRGGLEQEDRRPGGLSLDEQDAPDLLTSCEAVAAAVNKRIGGQEVYLLMNSMLLIF
jgi:hypothetical protein